MRPPAGRRVALRGRRTATVIGAWSDRPHAVPGGHALAARRADARRTDPRDRPPRADRRLRGDSRARSPTPPATTGIRACAGAPIVVDGSVWGAMSVDSTDGAPLPDDIEERLAEFTELVAAAFSTTASAGRARPARRRAGGAAAGGDARRARRAGRRAVRRRHRGGRTTARRGRRRRRSATSRATSLTAVGNWTAEGVDADTEVGRQWPLAGESLAPRILRTGRSARIDDWRDVPGPIADYVRDAARAELLRRKPDPRRGPGVGQPGRPLDDAGRCPRDTEERLAALHRARGDRDLERAGAGRGAAARGRAGGAAARGDARRARVGRRRRSSPRSPRRSAGCCASRTRRCSATRTTRPRPSSRAGAVSATSSSRLTRCPRAAATSPRGRPRHGEARADRRLRGGGRLARGAHAASVGIAAAVGCPDRGRRAGLWGVMVAAQRQPEPLPADTESRVAQFTELIATAISNVQARADLAASRARIVAAADDERRRVVRDLHDGAQQRLVHTLITLQLARDALAGDAEAVPALLDEALDHCQQAMGELRELAHGIMPAVFTHGGLRAGVEALAARTPVPVETDVTVGRLAPRSRRRPTSSCRGAHQRRQARPGRPRSGHRARRGRHARGRGARRRRRRRPHRRQRSARACATGSRCSTADSGWRARPAAARWSPP